MFVVRIRGMWEVGRRSFGKICLIFIINEDITGEDIMDGFERVGVDISIIVFI